MTETDIEVGALLRVTADPRDIWRVMRMTPKSVVMARCDGKGDVGAYATEWTFRKTSILRDFHPA